MVDLLFNKQQFQMKIIYFLIMLLAMPVLMASAPTKKIYPKVPVIKLNYDGAISAQTMNKKATGHPMQMAVEAPVNESTVKGNVTISGWALSFWGKNKVEVLKADNSLIGEAQYGQDRPDIDAKYPGYVNGEKSGFSYTLDTTKFPEGKQVIRLKVTASNGETKTADVSLSVKNVVPKPVPKTVPKQYKNQLPADWRTNGIVDTYWQLRYFIAKGVPIVKINDPKAKITYQKAQEIVNQVIKPGMTEAQKERALFDYMETHVRYAENVDYRIPGKFFNIGCSYGALVEGEAICGGYTDAMGLLLSMVGIKCYSAQGHIVNGVAGHAWNVVRINGIWYHVDATWHLLNITDEQRRAGIVPDKTIDDYDGEIPFPVCNTPFTQ